MNDIANKENAIAIIGVSIKFPDADDLDTFWQNLLNKHVAVSTFEKNTLAENNVSKGEMDHPDYVANKSILKDVFDFDAKFFNYSSKEAELTDPSQRHFLQLCQQVFDDAGYTPESVNTPIGVFAGVVESTYLYSHLVPQANLLEELGITKAKIACDKDFLATRASYKLNLTGPSLSVQTACSTGLVAVHSACQSLLSEEIDMAIAGASSISFPHHIGYRYRENSIYSKSGVCRPFDENSDGTVFGDGAAVVLLKRFDDAINDGDNILAVIEGTAINNDGASKAAYTAPSVQGQFDVIQTALANAEISPDELHFIETHGTGTSLGDAVEVTALKKIFSSTENKLEQPCYLGSAKGGVGHLNTCAGMVGLIKASLALKHRKYPPTANFDKVNPLLGLEGSGLEINRKTVEFNNEPNNELYAGVSSFGVGGTNAHVILSSPPQKIIYSTESVENLLLPVSAKSKKSLTAMNNALLKFIDNSDESHRDMAFTLREGRSKYPYRSVIQLTNNSARVISSNKNEQHCSWQFIDSDEFNIDALYPLYPSLKSDIDQLLALTNKEVSPHLRSLYTQYCVAKLFMSFNIDFAHIESTPSSIWLAAALLGDLSIDQAISFIESDKKADDFELNKKIIHEQDKQSTLHQDAKHFSINSMTLQVNTAEKFFEYIATLWNSGVDLDWSIIQPFEGGSRISMPGYIFDTQRYEIPLTPREETIQETTSNDNLNAKDLDQIVLNGYREVLGDESIELNDDFIEAGGDSMVAIDLMEYLEKNCDSKPTFDMLMKFTSPLLLTEALKAEQIGSASSTEIDEAELIRQDMALALRSESQSQINLSTSDTPVSTVLLTGATGFLGSSVLIELLNNSALTIACLVRGNNDEDAQSRLLQLLDARGIQDASKLSRIKVIPGNLKDPQLGLSEDARLYIQDKVDSIIHIGAYVNWVHPYERLRDENVLSTIQLAELALNGKCRFFNYVSSVAVFDGPHWPYSQCYDERCQLRSIDTLYTGYAKTKAVCETLLADYRSKGLDTRIFRPAYIMGDSRTCDYNPKDFIYLVLGSFIKLGCIPSVNYRVNLTPVDLVAKQMSQLSCTEDAANKTIHTLNSDAIYFEQIIKACKDCGLNLEVVSPDDFYQRLQNAAQNREIDGIVPFVDFFKPLSETSFAIGKDGMHGAGNYYDNAMLDHLMGGQHLRCDDNDDYLRRCIKKFVEKESSFEL